jgi:hypothetical protein
MDSYTPKAAGARSTQGDEFDDLAVDALEPINAPSLIINIAVALIGLDVGMLIAYYTR